MEDPLYSIIDYEDQYVQPLLLAALQVQLPKDLLMMIESVSELPNPSSRVLQWLQYEKIDFDHLMAHNHSSLANSYVFRKALIRKHFLSVTASHWLSKKPESVLRHHIKPSVEFEVDYAEFLDDALIEAFELNESWARNEALEIHDTQREWWILKPGMSDRGQGIRLFSSEEELQSIFEEWDPPSDDDNDDEPNEGKSDNSLNEDGDHGHLKDNNGIIASQLRHFVAQPYIHPPLLLPRPHTACGRKFHIRTYVLAVGALKIYVFKPMLALFASHSYTAPSIASSPNDDLPGHLTNTCLQTGEREGSVHAFWSLPSTIPGVSSTDWKQEVFSQICSITGEIFEAAARSMSIHFQPLPNAFEIYGIDFLVDANATAWLLEVNAFPDFAQTGQELGSLIQDLFENVVEKGIKSFFAIKDESLRQENGKMVEVLDIDLGRR